MENQFKAFGADLKAIDRFFPKQAAYPARTATCNRCGATNVAWVKNQAGRSYLANAGIITRESGEKVLVANKAYPHNCAETVRRNETAAAEQAAVAKKETERLEMIAAMQAQGIELDPTSSIESLSLTLVRWAQTNTWK
jgi:hypothetical protein